MAERQTTATLEQPQDLPSLLERLASDVTTLFDQKLTLLKIEIKEDVNAYEGLILIRYCMRTNGFR